MTILPTTSPKASRRRFVRRLASAAAAVSILTGSLAVAAPPAAPQMNDEGTRIAAPFASFSGLDKITGRIISFDVAIDETVQFGALQVTPRVCYSRPQTVAPLTTSFVEVDEITLDNKIRRIFTGWMYADSPGLHAVDHAVYDVWLTDCKASTSDPAANARAGVAPPAPAPADAAKPATGAPDAAKPAAAPKPPAPAAPKPAASAAPKPQAAPPTQLPTRSELPPLR